MPVTPNFNIFYPCESDPIDCDDFATFTNSVQDALDDMDVLAAQVLNRPTARIEVSASAQTFTVAVLTNTQFQLEFFDNDNMANLAVNNDRLTVQTEGIYLVNGSFNMSAPFTTITSEALALSQNGTVRYRKKNHFNGNVTQTLQVIGLFDCQVGDILRLAYLWTGTGGPSTVFDANLSAQLVAIR